MPYSILNKQQYGKRHIVSDYAYATLQYAEVMIFVKYREFISGKQVLDIGCGAGRTSALLKNLTSDYTGIDYSCDMIQHCKKKFKDVHFLHADARDLKMFGDNTFDFVLFSFNGLDAMCHKDRLAGLREIYRVLRHDGLFVFSSHNRNHRNAKSSPKLKLSFNPCAQIAYGKNYILSWYYHTKNKKLELYEKEYCIINDRAHQYSLLNYYIDKQNQISQLEHIGFETLEMFDTFGNMILSNDNDSDSAWIYYVARKK